MNIIVNVGMVLKISRIFFFAERNVERFFFRNISLFVLCHITDETAIPIIKQIIIKYAFLRLVSENESSIIVRAVR